MFDNSCTGIVFFLFLLFLIFAVVLPSFSRSRVSGSRQTMIRRIENKRKSRVIVMIHRQESVSWLGMPLSRYIDIEDSEQVLRAIHLTKPDVPIDLIVHTPGGLVLAAEQIANALVRHKAPVTVMVPHYAMSGGTLLALSADQILMDPNAVLGPVDPQLGSMPAAGYVELRDVKGAENISDESFMMASMSEKALSQVHASVVRLLRANGMDEAKATELADTLSTGKWTHDYPIFFDEAVELGLPVSDELPVEVYRLMDLYPQSSSRQRSVQYVPTPEQGGRDSSSES